MSEKPRFTKPLIAEDVEQFIRSFAQWAENERLTVDQTKCQLAWSFKDSNASRWFSINFLLVFDRNYSFEQLCDAFMEFGPLVRSERSILRDMLMNRGSDDYQSAQTPTIRRLEHSSIEVFLGPEE